MNTVQSIFLPVRSGGRYIIIISVPLNNMTYVKRFESQLIGKKSLNLGFN